MKKKKNQIRILLLLGIIIVIVSPYFFTLSFGWFDFTETGQIGDTIGGITAPVVNLIGAILVFYALDAQIEANRIIQNQIDEKSKQEFLDKKLTYINSLFNNFKNDVDSFHHQEKVTLKGSHANTEALSNSKGARAIAKVIDNLKFYAHDPHDNDKTFEFSSLNELIGIIDLGIKLARIIDQESIDQTDKDFFFAYLNHYLEYKIWPEFGALLKDYENGKPCEQCGVKHGQLPIKLYSSMIKFRSMIEEHVH